VTPPKTAAVTPPKTAAVTPPKTAAVTPPKTAVTPPKTAAVTPGAAPPEPAETTEGTDPRVAKLLADGDEALRQGSNTRAMKAFFDAAQLAPKHTEALYKLGLVYYRTGNVKAAKYKWRSVLKIDPAHAAARLALEKADAPKTAGAKAAPPEKPGLAKATPAPKPPEPAPAKAASDVDQKKLAKLLAEGDAEFQKKAFSRAISSYTHAAQLDPKSEEALFKLGVAYAMTGNYNVAIYKWQRVLEINPANKAARNNIERARAKMQGGPPQPPSPAPKVLPAPPEKKPEPETSAKGDSSFEAHMARARQLKSQGDAKGVLESVDRALKQKSDPAALILKGEALVVLKRYGEAKRTFSKAMVLDPNLAAPFFGLGETCRLAGDADRARYYFKMYVRSKAKDKVPAQVEQAQKFIQGK
ncbi:MAG: tetratricopeptide repeat protein, partial [Deltaproteobacteria bacterium]|nr:tetratricopeptide repeat protein [Deltaproteobacteria bacterium]